MHTIRPIILVALAIAALSPAPARAVRQTQQSEPDSAKTHRRDRMRTLDAVKVTAHRRPSYAAPTTSSASRTDLPLRDTPRAVSVVTDRLIADQSMQSMADVAHYVPGITMAAGEGHRDAPTIRGNSTTADFFVDGARDDAQYLRDLYNAERIEVLKGSEALLFGRGGGGGIINRVTKQASWTPTLSLSTEGGSFDHKRALLDAGRAITDRLAARANAVYERSGGFRDAMTLRRYGLNPTVALLAGSRTVIRAGYELFDDRRRVDRGIPSFQGAPAPTSRTTFFGNPNVNHSTARVNIGALAVDHSTGAWLLRNHTTWASYDKFYQNSYPGAVDAAGTRVTLSAYNHAIDRRNLINVTDLSRKFSIGAVQHTLLAGVDLTRQRTNQVRLTGYYNDSLTSFSAPLASPTVSTPVSFRASATDADNHAIVNDAATYVQDQIALSEALLVVAGVRYERFRIDYYNHRNGQALSRSDRLLSPRAGVVLKPATPVSLYASYGRSYLPSSGDQFTALTVTTSTLEPERFTNREIGAKWDVLPDLSLAAAAYRLDRTNTTSPDPNDATRVVQTGAQRTTGWELAATGAPTPAWQIATGFGSQRATIVSRTSAAREGATVALVPHATASLWNRYQLTDAFGIGLGLIHQTSMYAAIDNTVTLPGFTRADAAVYATLRRGVRAQINVENLFDTHYFATSHGNNNIMPGAPRTIRVGLTLRPLVSGPRSLE